MTPARANTWSDELVVTALGEIVHARSGDKGGDANVGVWVRDAQAWEWLRSTLTVDELRRLLPETRELADRALRIAQPRRGQLPHPRIARDRRHLVAAAGRAGQSTRRMAARTQHQSAEIACRQEGTDERPRREHHRRRPQGHPRAGPQLRLRVLASEGQARRIPVGVRQGVRPGRMARRAHPRAVRRAGARHRGVRRDDAGNRRLRCRREWRLRGPLLPVPTRAHHPPRLGGDEAGVPAQARPRRDPHGVRRHRAHRRGGHLAHQDQGREGRRRLGRQRPESVDQQRTERPQDPAAGAHVCPQRGQAAGRDDAVLHRPEPRPDHRPRDRKAGPVGDRLQRAVHREPRGR